MLSIKLKIPQSSKFTLPERNKLELYEPISFKYEETEMIEEKISKLSSSVLEIIFYQSNIAIVWNEMISIEEL